MFFTSPDGTTYIWTAEAMAISVATHMRLKEGKTLETIASELRVDLEVVESIYALADILGVLDEIEEAATFLDIVDPDEPAEKTKPRIWKEGSTFNDQFVEYWVVSDCWSLFTTNSWDEALDLLAREWYYRTDRFDKGA